MHLTLQNTLRTTALKKPNYVTATYIGRQHWYVTNFKAYITSKLPYCSNAQIFIGTF